MQEHFELSSTVFLGASGGAIVSALMALEVPMAVGLALNNAMRRQSQRRPLGPVFHGISDLEALLLPALPADPHVAGRLSSGRLRLSLTRVADLTNVQVCAFTRRKDVARTVMASMNLPIFGFPFSRLPGDELFIDGCLSDNRPTLDEATVTVSPFPSSGADVSVSTRVPLGRFVLPGDPPFMQQLSDRGWADAAARHELFVARGFMATCEPHAGKRAPLPAPLHFDDA